MATKAHAMAEANLADVFDACQHTVTAHKRGWLRCRELQDEDADGFREEFVEHVDRVLVVWKREPAVERLCSFIVGFVCSPEQQKGAEGSLFMHLIRHLLDVADAKDKAVRFRATDIIARMMQSLDDEAEIDEELYEQLLAQMLKRGQDKFPVVRAAAVHALSRLQQIDDDEDPVTSQYLRLLATDSCKDVRIAVLNCVHLSSITLPHILKRTRDISEEIRVLAYQVISKKVSMKAMTIEQRMTLINDGLRSRDEKVKHACEEMVCEWYTTRYKDMQGGDGIIQFLAALDVEESEEIVSLALRCLIARGHLDQDIQREKEAELQKRSKREFERAYRNEEDDDNQSPSVIESQPDLLQTEQWYSFKRLEADLSCERAFCWRLICEYLKSEKLLNRLDELMPEIAKFCRLLQKNAENEFVMNQLLRLGFIFDLSDEAGRRALSALLRQLLIECLSMYVIESILKLLRHIHSREDEYTRLVLEILSDIRDPLDDLDSDEVKAAQQEAERRYDDIQDRLEVIEQDLKRAKTKAERDELKKERSELQTESQTIEQDHAALQNLEDVVLERSLVVTKALLQSTTKDLRDGGIMGLLQAVIIPSLQHEEAAMRRIGVECLGLYCLLHEQTAKDYLALLHQVILNDEDSVKEAAIQALFDFLLAFRWNESHFLPKEKNDESDHEGDRGESLSPSLVTYSNVIDSLMKFLNSEDEHLCTLAVEGWAKLLLHDVVQNEELLSRILVLSFDPSTEEDFKLRQCISTFFPLYAFSSHKVHHQQAIASAFLPTLRLFLKASPDSPLRSVDLTSVAQFLLFLTDESHTLSKPFNDADGVSDCAHARLAKGILNEILCNPKGKEGKALPKVLNLLKLVTVIDDGEPKRRRPTQRMLLTQRTVKTLRLLVEDAMEAVTDRNATRSLTKFCNTVMSLEEEPDAALDEEEIESIRQESCKQKDAYVEDEEPRKSTKKKVTATASRKPRTKASATGRNRRVVEEEPSEASEDSEDNEDEEVDYEALDAQDSDSSEEDSEEAKEIKVRPKRANSGAAKKNPNQVRSEEDEDDRSQTEEEEEHVTIRKAQPKGSFVSKSRRARAALETEESESSDGHEDSSEDEPREDKTGGGGKTNRKPTVKPTSTAVSSESESESGEEEVEPSKREPKRGAGGSDDVKSTKEAEQKSVTISKVKDESVRRNSQPTDRPTNRTAVPKADARHKDKNEPVRNDPRQVKEKQERMKQERERSLKAEQERKRKEEEAMKEELTRKREEMLQRKNELERQKAKREAELIRQKEEEKRKEAKQNEIAQRKAAEQRERQKAEAEMKRKESANRRRRPSSSDESSDSDSNSGSELITAPKQKLVAMLNKEVDHMLQSDEDSSDAVDSDSDSEEEEVSERRPNTVNTKQASVAKSAIAEPRPNPKPASRTSAVSKPSTAPADAQRARAAVAARPTASRSSVQPRTAVQTSKPAVSGSAVARTASSAKPSATSAKAVSSTKAKENVAPRAAPTRPSVPAARERASEEASATSKRPTATTTARAASKPVPAAASASRARATVAASKPAPSASVAPTTTASASSSRRAVGK